MSNKAHFTIVSVSGLAAFPATAQVINPIRNPLNLMFVCSSGTNVEYSFDGVTTHGRISANQSFTFLTRNEARVWFKGTGVVDVHAWGAA